jgi:sialic acid synthase SpsE
MKININLGKRTIKKDSLPYIIAEIGVNHNGSMKLAKELIELAKLGGADAVKFQSYKANKIAQRESPAYWDLKKEPTSSQYDLFKKYDNFNSEDYFELAEYSKKLNIDFLSTPFDLESVEYLNPMVPFFKISSSDITHIPLLRKIGEKNKPVVLSTGASSVSEIKNAIKILTDSGCSEIALLHCILNYPTAVKNANLRMIRHLQGTFPNHIVGYSDHTIPDQRMNILIAAYLLGAVIIEKHFTNDKSLLGNDHYHSMDKNDLNLFVKKVKYTSTKLGNSRIKAPIDTEEISRKNARRSIVVNRNVEIGSILSSTDLICKRPENGISSCEWDRVIGKKVKRKILKDQLLSWDDL